MSLESAHDYWEEYHLKMLEVEARQAEIEACQSIIISCLERLACSVKEARESLTRPFEPSQN